MQSIVLLNHYVATCIPSKATRVWCLMAFGEVRPDRRSCLTLVKGLYYRHNGYSCVDVCSEVQCIAALISLALLACANDSTAVPHEHHQHTRLNCQDQQLHLQDSLD